MKNKVIVLFQDINKVRLILNKLGYFDMLVYCNQIEECVSLCKGADDCQKMVVICENKFIDDIVEQIKQEKDAFELLEEQALIIKSEEKETMFLPYELDLQHFLKLFLEEKEVFVLTVFGKSKNSVKTAFESFNVEENLSYEIITKSEFLHTVYYSKEIDDERLKQTFGESLISFKDESLAQACGRVLNEKNLSIAIAEQFTAGAITSRLKLDGKANILSSVLLLHDDDIVEIPKSLIEEKGVVSKEIAFNLAKKLAQTSDLALGVVANEHGKSFVAVGNKEEIHVFSAVFEGEETTENIINFAMFRLLKYLS